MFTDDTHACKGSDIQEVLADLVEAGLLEMQPGELLWKLYCFRDPGHSTGLRHRIYAKQKAGGRLALVTFAVHYPAVDGIAGDAEGTNGRGARPQAVRSAVARVADLSPADLDRLTAAVKEQVAATQCEELDLTRFASLHEQLAWLQDQA